MTLSWKRLSVSRSDWLALSLVGLLGFSGGVAAEDSLLNLGAEAQGLSQGGERDGNGEENDLSRNQPQVDKGGMPNGGKNGEADKAQKNAESETPPEWGYHDDKAPRHWADLSETYALCGSGQAQSPIDIKRQGAVGTTGLPGFDIHYRETVLKTEFDGKRLKVNIPVGSYIRLQNRRYELTHYEFHTPSEHHKDGFAYPAELQLVHKDGEDNYVVVAILFREGDAHEDLAIVLENLPGEINQEKVNQSVKLPPANFIPGTRKFYKYHGSLTHPPCDEGIYWMVFDQPLEASVSQLQRLQDYLGNNARPVQPLKARTLLKSWPDQSGRAAEYEFYYTP
jgi:carbonic anhydrase